MKSVEDSIADWLSSVEPDSKLLRTWTLGGGISSAMTAFTLSRDDATQTLILRQPNDWSLVNGLANVPNAVSTEFSRLGALHRGGLPVQAPFFCDPTGAHFGRPGLVLEYIDGQPDLEPDDPSKYVDQFARQLADIHRFDRQTPDLALAAGTSQEFEYYRERTMPQADAAYQVERIWAVLSAHASVQSNNGPVLLHGDFWPGNTLWREGCLVAVIDWENARTGDPLLDLSISRLDICWVCGHQAMEEFTHLYLTYNPIDTALLPLWDLRTSLRPVMNMATWASSYRPLGRPDVTSEYMQKTRSGFVSQAFEALDKLQFN